MTNSLIRHAMPSSVGRHRMPGRDMREGGRRRRPVARSSRNPSASQRLCVGGLGPEALWRTTERVCGEHDLVMLGLGLPGGSWHFGLTRDPERPLEPAPAGDDLFVLPLGTPADGALVDRLVAARGTRAAAHKPLLGPARRHRCRSGRLPPGAPPARLERKSAADGRAGARRRQNSEPGRDRVMCAVRALARCRGPI